MRDRVNPRALDVATLCRESVALDGRLPLSELPRLGGSLFGAPDAGAEATWSALATQKPVAGGEPERSLLLKAQAEVTLQCQRCLQALRQPLVVERRFRFVRSEQEAARLDEEIDDDVLVLPPRLDLLDLLEDELILALPIVPRHEGVCPQPLPMATAPLVDAVTPNPFAKLAALRGGIGRGDPGDA
jgi:uncharacterized protein